MSYSWGFQFYHWQCHHPVLLIRDLVYPLLLWVMKPYRGQRDHQKEHFNYYLSRCHMMVDCTSATSRHIGWQALSVCLKGAKRTCHESLLLHESSTFLRPEGRSTMKTWQSRHGMQTRHGRLSIYSTGMGERVSPLLMLGALAPYRSGQFGSTKAWLNVSSLLRTRSPPQMGTAGGLGVPILLHQAMDLLP